ncbi:MAG: sulfotransferase [Defluviicoccus sp.]|nr:sulfotransferase [Defluviicoccus sp.]
MSARTRRRLMHPLCGADIATLVRVLGRNGGVAPWALPQAALALAVAAARLPSSLAERAWVARALRQAGDMPPPVFIVGHWRTGTTHLFNILARHGFSYVSPLAAGMPWDSMGLTAALRPLLERMLPRDRMIDAIPVEPDSPQEDEIPLANMSAVSFYHGIYFPRRFAGNFDRGVFFESCTAREVGAWKETLAGFSRKTWLAGGRRRLLVKNPVHTARIPTIREIWPDAKFVHCVRDPFEVFRSMRNFYDTLFPALALQPHDPQAVERIVLDGYSRLMDRFIADRPDIPDGNFHEIRYERLTAQPMEEVAALYDALGLDGFEAAEPAFRRYLDGIGDYRRNRYDDPPEQRAKVAAAWRRYIEHWGYDVPGGEGGVG